MFRELLFTGVIIAILASMLLPLPPALIDFLLVGNLLLALVLLLSSLYINDPLKLSSLPTILLLATLYRLALNISTTRLILGSGDAGELIKAFGAVVIQGNLIVGAIVFIVITIVQFLVIAKGAERVAEVSARFTLDALPGKQMSIDADVRAGMIDFQTARKKRDDLQTESRFYGALDGAMKFVKGDAIAGILITVVNVLGGLAVGILIGGLGLRDAVAVYTLLTVGDGLVSQIPALLNAVAAGIVITRVVREEKSSLIIELISQLGQIKRVKVMIALAFLGIAMVPSMPVLPFLILSLCLLLSSALTQDSSAVPDEVSPFTPRVPPVLEIRLARGQSILRQLEFQKMVETVREDVFNEHGLILPQPELGSHDEECAEVKILMRGIQYSVHSLEESEESVLSAIAASLRRLVLERRVEFIDDVLTRRTLDYFDSIAPELVSAVVPNLISVTQLTKILKALGEENVSIRNFDLILQAVAEHASLLPDERLLLEEVRCRLQRVHRARVFGAAESVQVYTVDPVLDLALLRAQQDQELSEFELVDLVKQSLKTDSATRQILVSSKSTRRFLFEQLQLHGMMIEVYSHDELVNETALESARRINFSSDEMKEQIMEAIAA